MWAAGCCCCGQLSASRPELSAWEKWPSRAGPQTCLKVRLWDFCWTNDSIHVTVNHEAALPPSQSATALLFHITLVTFISPDKWFYFDIVLVFRSVVSLVYSDVDSFFAFPRWRRLRSWFFRVDLGSDCVEIWIHSLQLNWGVQTEHLVVVSYLFIHWTHIQPLLVGFACLMTVVNFTILKLGYNRLSFICFFF